MVRLAPSICSATSPAMRFAMRTGQHEQSRVHSTGARLSRASAFKAKGGFLECRGNVVAEPEASENSMPSTSPRDPRTAEWRNLLTALTAMEGIRSGGLAAPAAAFWADRNRNIISGQALLRRWCRRQWLALQPLTE